MSNGAGTIGDRSGAAVDLRFFADVSGIYDTGIQPFALNSKGGLETVNGVYGVQADAGVYGTHMWRNALLGLDFGGNFYHFDNASYLDGSTERLMLGYTWQKSRHLVFDFRESAGTSSLAYGFGYYQPATGIANQPTSLLFDNRVYFGESTADMTYIQSARTSYSVGGDGFVVRREASGLAATNGYSVHGTIQHRLSKTKTIGFTYQHMYFEFPPAFGNSTADMGQGFFATSLGRRWAFQLRAGAFRSDVVGLQQVALNPVIAALLGTSVGIQAFHRQDIYPAGEATLSARLKNSLLAFDYSQTVVPGNGVYLTSRQNSGTANYSYTGIHKWNFGVNGGYYELFGIGQGIKPYQTYSGGAGFTYGLSRSFHIVGHYDARHQEITNISGYRNTGYRVMLGLAFSPGDKPLSLW